MSWSIVEVGVIAQIKFAPTLFESSNIDIVIIKEGLRIFIGCCFNKLLFLAILRVLIYNNNNNIKFSKQHAFRPGHPQVSLKPVCTQNVSVIYEKVSKRFDSRLDLESEKPESLCALMIGPIDPLN